MSTYPARLHSSSPLHLNMLKLMLSTGTNTKVTSHMNVKKSLTWSDRSARSTLFLFCRSEYSACSTVKPQSTICWTLWSNSCKKKTKTHAMNEKVQVITTLADNPYGEENNFHTPNRKLNTPSPVMWCHIPYLLSGLFNDNVKIWMNGSVWKQVTTVLSIILTCH